MAPPSPTAGPPTAGVGDLAPPDDPTSTTSTSRSSARCCPNNADECEEFMRLPIHLGLMITLGKADATTSRGGGGGGRRASSGGGDGNDENDDDDARCVRLDLRPQEDAGLPGLHPNICVPRAILERPDLLVRYGGGGSGVTVFGGHHPLLGHLVMKHGGHKDLIELVSLATIEREIGVRAKFAMESILANDGGGDDDARPYARSTPSAPRGGGSGGVRWASWGARATRQDGMYDDDARRRLVPSSIGARSTGRGPTPSPSPDEYDREREGSGMRAREVQLAAEDMKRRVPSFRMIYISPMHVRDRSGELLNNSFSRARIGSHVHGVANGMDPMPPPPKVVEGLGMEVEAPPTMTSSSSDVGPAARADPREGQMTGSDANESTATNGASATTKKKGRALHLFGSLNVKASSIRARPDHVDLCFGGAYHLCTSGANDGDDEDVNIHNQPNPKHDHPSGSNGIDGYASLMAFVEHLRDEQELNKWKITLAQQRIGQGDGDSRPPRTASYFLAKGMLHGPLLHHLIESEIKVIRNLQLLTMPEEMTVVDKVRAEYENIIACQRKRCRKVSASEVSKIADDFTGKAIKKNYDPVNGRFVLLNQFRRDLQRNNIHLKPKEVVPARHLETLFCDFCASWEDTFHLRYDQSNVKAYPGPNRPIFDCTLDQWESLLELSLSMKHPNATNRIWTSGLTDGGLHNMFLSESHLVFFDLGTPTLEPIPAFLTKFLMSFFHTLGMDEDEDGNWIVRFEQDDAGKLRPTEQTMEILPKVMFAFNTAMDRLIEEFFGDEEEIRVLLLRYVVTQLLSDAAFCIEKWRIKGGGDEMRSTHQYFLEKWLWRALWDVYISEEIRRRYWTRILLRRESEQRRLGV
ncbi:hypothetical protein ACHAW5_006090 [Stephanodiscus triporus]|uniref:Selenoprotein O n=1 Tax=Stephanodiscus triporus TaxID=2934178 RepID=A0ABD3MMP9_9STRA